MYVLVSQSLSHLTSDETNTKVEDLLMNWLCGSFKPFTDLDDAGFREFAQSLIGARKHLKVPHEPWAREQATKRAELARGVFRDLFKV